MIGTVSMQSLNKKILIVGGASGIGRATTDMLIARGYRPLVVDNSEKNLKQCAAEWGGKCNTLFMDIGKRDNVRDGLKWITESEGLVDVVVITAGLHSCYPVEYLPDDVIDRVIDVNLVSHISLPFTIFSILFWFRR